MTVLYGYKCDDRFQEKHASKISAVLAPMEVPVFICKTSNIRPHFEILVVTNFRLLAFDKLNHQVQRQAYLRDIKGSQIGTSFTKSSQLLVSLQDGEEISFGIVHKNDQHELLRLVAQGEMSAVPGTHDNFQVENLEETQGPPGEFSGVIQIDNLNDQGFKQEGSGRIDDDSVDELAETIVIGGALRGEKVTPRVRSLIKQNMHGEERPWLIVSQSASAGYLVAFEDRLLIIKAGALAGFMSGSLGGARVSTFFYRDINAIEYNSGFANGVLEILTASFQGTANKDYWRGTDKSRNADSNDPWTLSNCLPLSKAIYQSATQQFNQLRERIAKAKNTTVVINNVSDSKDLAEQIRDLGNLHKEGILTDEEFANAKAKLLGK